MFSLLALAALVPVTLTAPTNPVKATVLYWESQYAASYPVSALDFTAFDQLTFYVVAPSANGTLLIDSALADELVSTAHKNNVQAGVTVGGLNGTAVLSGLVNDANRTNFAQQLVNMVNRYQFDALEFDWADPAMATTDIENLGKLFTQFRTLSKTRLGFTIGWTSPNPAWNALAQIAWPRLFAFFWWDPFTSTTSGAVSPAYTCAGQPTNVSVQSLLDGWLDSGLPASKMMLVLAPAAYNYTGVTTLSTSTASGSSLTQPAVLNSAPQADNPSDPMGLTNTGDIVKAGELSTTLSTAENGFTRFWDDCTKTPYLISPSTGTLIAYEDTESIQAKVALGVDRSVIAVGIFSSRGDTSDLLLTKAARAAANPSASDSGGLGKGFIALWVMIPIVVLAIVGLTFSYFRRKRRAQAAAASARKVLPSSPDMKSVDGSTLDEKTAF